MKNDSEKIDNVNINNAESQGVKEQLVVNNIPPVVNDFKQSINPPSDVNSDNKGNKEEEEVEVEEIVTEGVRELKNLRTVTEKMERDLNKQKDTLVDAVEEFLKTGNGIVTYGGVALAFDALASRQAGQWLLASFGIYFITPEAIKKFKAWELSPSFAMIMVTEGTNIVIDTLAAGIKPLLHSDPKGKKNNCCSSFSTKTIEVVKNVAKVPFTNTAIRNGVIMALCVNILTDGGLLGEWGNKDVQITPMGFSGNFAFSAFAYLNRLQVETNPFSGTLNFLHATADAGLTFSGMGLTYKSSNTTANSSTIIDSESADLVVGYKYNLNIWQQLVQLGTVFAGVKCGLNTINLFVAGINCCMELNKTWGQYKKIQPFRKTLREKVKTGESKSLVDKPETLNDEEIKRQTFILLEQENTKREKQDQSWGEWTCNLGGKLCHSVAKHLFFFNKNSNTENQNNNNFKKL